MEYILTQEDIDRYGFTDAIEGDKATPAELSTMGMYTAPFAPQEERAGQLSVPMPSVEVEQLKAAPVASRQGLTTQELGAVPNKDRYMSGYSALRSLGLDSGQTYEALAGMGAVDVPPPVASQTNTSRSESEVKVDQSDTSRYQPTFSEMSLAQRGFDTTQATPKTDALIDILSKPISQDPFEGLSRNQRTMLAFAAMRDAGAALRGQEGTAFNTTLAGFRDLKDMERKRQIQVAQLEQDRARKAQIDALLMPSSVVGAAPTSDVSALPKSTVSLNKQIAALRSQLGTYASLDQMDAYNARMSELEGDLEAANIRETAEKEKIQVSEGKLLEAKGAMSAAKRALSASLGMEEGEEFDQYLENAVAGGQFDPSPFFVRRQSWVPDSRPFKDFQAAANQLGAIMTFQNMSDVIKAGAKLGILSDSDIRLLGSLSGVIDPVNMPVQSAENILRLYDKLGQTITRLEGELSGGDEIDAMLKKYGISD